MLQANNGVSNILNTDKNECGFKNKDNRINTIFIISYNPFEYLK